MTVELSTLGSVIKTAYEGEADTNAFTDAEKAAVATNSAKVTNATHSGDAVGDTALTLQPAAITGKGAVTVAAGDLLLVADVSASPQVLGQVTASSVAALATPEGTAILSTGEVGGSKFLREDGDGTCSWQTVAVGTGDLKADGTVPLTADWDVGAFQITALRFHSDEATLSPFTVASSAVVTNLNADLLDGNEASAFAAAAHNHDSDYISVVGTPTAGNFPQLTAGGELVNSTYDETSFATAAQANATHSGDAVGDGALTLQPAAITGKGAVTVAGADHVLVVDDSASPQTLGKTTAQAVADLAKPTESIIVACSDETTALTTGTAKVTFRMPYAFTLTEVRATVTTAPVGSSIIVDINEKVGTPSPDVPTSILSTRLYIDAGEFSSEDASVSPAHQSVISDTSLADDSEITIDIDQIGASTAGAGLKVELIGKRT